MFLRQPAAVGLCEVNCSDVETTLSAHVVTLLSQSSLVLRVREARSSCTTASSLRERMSTVASLESIFRAVVKRQPKSIVLNIYSILRCGRRAHPKRRTVASSEKSRRSILV